jgi:hypothetical protein
VPTTRCAQIALRAENKDGTSHFSSWNEIKNTCHCRANASNDRRWNNLFSGLRLQFWLTRHRHSALPASEKV